MKKIIRIVYVNNMLTLSNVLQFLIIDKTGQVDCSVIEICLVIGYGFSFRLHVAFTWVSIPKLQLGNLNRTHDMKILLHHLKEVAPIIEHTDHCSVVPFLTTRTRTIFFILLKGNLLIPYHVGIS